MLRGSRTRERRTWLPLIITCFMKRVLTIDKIRRFFRTRKVYIGSRPDPFRGAGVPIISNR